MRHLFTFLPIMIFSLFSTSCTPDPEAMNGKGLEAVISGFAGSESLVVNGNVIEFSYENVPLVCIYDELHNRMRIISAICKYQDVTPEQMDRMMESNFHSALDARYAASRGVLYSAYIHPLESMSAKDVVSAIYQVASLSISFGGEYSSGVLQFGGESDAEAPDEFI